MNTRNTHQATANTPDTVEHKTGKIMDGIRTYFLLIFIILHQDLARCNRSISKSKNKEGRRRKAGRADTASDVISVHI